MNKPESSALDTRARSCVGMKARPPVGAELSWPQVHAFRLVGHHLHERAPKKDLTRVVGRISGVQAQLMSAAELQVAVRVDCTAEDVRTALWKDKSLVKTWLMRGTLHLVPSADLPLYTAALRAGWVWPTDVWLKWTKLAEPELRKLISAIGDALERPMTREELIAVVGRGQSEHIREVLNSGWSTLLKPVARNGRLCFGPSQGQRVTFVRPERWLGSWSDLDPDKALVEVARRYLGAYGPATKNDFARWWGGGRLGAGRAAWNGLGRELVTVSVEGHRAEMLEGDLRMMANGRDGPSVQLLPLFDPYLLGHASRDHLVEAVHRARVSRTAGWISAVVLVDGRVAATWSHTVAKETLRIAVEPLRRLPPKAQIEIRNRAEELAATLGLARAEVRVAR